MYDDMNLLNLMNAVLQAQADSLQSQTRYYALPPRQTSAVSIPQFPQEVYQEKPPAPTYNITYNMPASSSSSSPPPPPPSQPSPSYTFGIGPAGVPEGASSHITHDTPGFTEWAMQHFSTW